MKFSPIELEIFKNRFASICEEMGVALCRSAFSTNIKERKDFSCALFDGRGNLIAQAAHIPVHLGSMPLSVQAALRAFTLRPGDCVILNDPYSGGTHLPDITLVTPVFTKGIKIPTFYVANRAHHADVGGKTPGSMPLATHLEEEGIIIPPTLFKKRGKIQRRFLNYFLSQVRGKKERKADLLAQESANFLGAKRLQALVAQHGTRNILRAMAAYRQYEEKITRKALSRIPKGIFLYQDVMDSDGISPDPVPLSVKITVRRDAVTVDFRDNPKQVAGPINATRAITLSCVAYVFRCLVNLLTGEDCLSLQPIQLLTRKGTVPDARYPAPVSGGNVETSQRLVDVLLGALAQALPKAIPAASQGTMNNLAMGNQNFSYYETLAGGSGAGPWGNGTNAIHTHMTNTLNTPIEALETQLPLRISTYHIRKNSGGKGQWRGGDGLVREYEFLEDTEMTLMSERRIFAPYGLKGGKGGQTGANWLIAPAPRKSSVRLKIKLPGKVELKARKGNRLRIETPGGGGFGTRR